MCSYIISLLLISLLLCTCASESDLFILFYICLSVCSLHSDPLAKALKEVARLKSDLTNYDKVIKTNKNRNIVFCCDLFSVCLFR